MKRYAYLVLTLVFGFALTGCGGGGGGSNTGTTAPRANPFTAAVQSAMATSPEDGEPAELNIDAAGDTGADDEPLTL